MVKWLDLETDHTPPFTTDNWWSFAFAPAIRLQNLVLIRRDAFTLLYFTLRNTKLDFDLHKKMFICILCYFADLVLIYCRHKSVVAKLIALHIKILSLCFIRVFTIFSKFQRKVYAVIGNTTCSNSMEQTPP
jgi:hypothetical protein